MRSNLSVFILFTGIIATSPTATFATDDPLSQAPSYWNASLGTGVGGSSEVGGFVSVVDVTLPVKERALTLRVANYDDTFGTIINSAFDDSSTQHGFVKELGALLSWVHYGRWSQRSVGAGVSYLTGTDVGINRSNFTTLGIPLYAEAVFTPSRYVGIGVKASATLTSDHSLAVILMTFNFGILN